MTDRTTSTTRRSAVVTLGITALVAGGVTGCGRTAERDYAGVCVDKQTQQRVDDSECRNGRGGFGWYYLRNGARFPRVGGSVAGGSYSTPSGSSYVDGGLSKSGGSVDAGKVTGGKVHTVTKGGFGGLGGKAGS